MDLSGQPCPCPQPETEPATPDLYAGRSGQVFAPPAVTTQFAGAGQGLLGYDADGNLLSDDRWAYTWDARNRLIQMIEHDIPGATSRTRLVFHYDHMDRRRIKEVYRGNESDPQLWAHQYTLHFVYDGWNLIGEITPGGDLERSYTWGLDLSGSLHGAGGIGGLLVATIDGDDYLPVVDANGHVTELVKPTNGNVEAAYRYGPFGEPLRTSGDPAEANPFRYSTKYTDPETGHLYFGHRYYSPLTGRWLSRDPLRENGGINLHAYVNNDPIQYIDPTGLVGSRAFRDFLGEVAEMVTRGTVRSLDEALEDPNVFRAFSDKLSKDLGQSSLTDIQASRLKNMLREYADKPNLNLPNNWHRHVLYGNAPVPLDDAMKNFKSSTKEKIHQQLRQLDIRPEDIHVTYKGSGYTNFSEHSFEVIKGRVEIDSRMLDEIGFRYSSNLDAASDGRNLVTLLREKGFDVNLPPSNYNLYTWHHTETGGLALVPTPIHDAYSHSGFRSLLNQGQVKVSKFSLIEAAAGSLAAAVIAPATYAYINGDPTVTMASSKMDAIVQDLNPVARVVQGSLDSVVMMEDASEAVGEAILTVEDDDGFNLWDTLSNPEELFGDYD